MSADIMIATLDGSSPATGKRLIADANGALHVIGPAGGLPVAGTTVPNTAVAAVSLSGVSVPATPITVAAGTTKQIRAALFTNTSYALLARVTASDASDATTIETAVAMTVHGGAALRVTAPATAAAYVHCVLVDGDGAAALGGANDRILVGTE